MRQTRKYNYYFIFSLAELLLLLLFSVNILTRDVYEHTFNEYLTEMSEVGETIYTERIALPKGIYRVTVRYERDRGDGVCYAQAGEKGVHSLYTDHVRLSSLQSEKRFDIYVNDDVDDLRLAIETEGSNTFIFKEANIVTAANARAYQILCMAVKLLLINIIAAFVYNRDKKCGKRTELIGILAIGIVASAGLMEEYILYGHDLVFHLLRIEGLKDGLLASGYPVRIQPNWFNGWGYPVSVMYGDQLLYFPALLRLAGVSVQNAYKCYIAAVNIGTAAVAYYVFFQISRDKAAALFGSCLYTLFPYRLSCIYVRAALGEYSAMMFLPLVALCFWYVFEAKEDEKIADDKLLIPVIGFTGLIQTHVLTCFLTAFMIFLLCIIHFKRIFKKNVLCYLLWAAVITVLVNLWFIVPFFQYMGEELEVTAKTQMTPAFQRWGAGIAELFAVYWNGTLESAWGEIVTIARKFPKPIGTAYLLMLVIAAGMHDKEKTADLKKKIRLCMFFFILSAFMASTAFPYDKINKLFPALGSLFQHIQFSYRFLTMTGLFGGILAVLTVMELTRVYGKKAAMAVIALIGLLAVIQGAQLIYSTMYRGDVFLAYDIAALDNNAFSTGEYLYEGSWPLATEQIQAPSGEGAAIEGYQKQYNKMAVTCKSKTEDAYILLPMFYYIGYEAYDTATHQKLELIRSGDNNRIRVNLPAGYEGTVQIRFKDRISWRIAQAVSFLTIAYLIVKRTGKKKCCTAYLKRV